MTPRERMRAALAHQEPDRVPIDFGQDFHNGIHEVAYGRLLARLGMGDAGPIRLYDYMQRLAAVDPRVLDRFGVDTRYIMAKPCDSFHLDVEEDGSFEDEWGVYRKRCGHYCDTVRSPLANASKSEILRHRFPDPANPARYRGLREHAQQLYEGTDYALAAGQAASLFYLTAELRGFERFMSDLASEPDVIEVLLDRVLEWMIEMMECYLGQIGTFIEICWLGDDWGMQTGPIMNPDIFRRLFKPRYRELLEAMRFHTRAKVCLHTCGATYWILKDLADLPIDVIHPLQPTAKGNDDPERLKREFGNRFVFYSNIANSTVLPHGTPAEVAEEARRKIRALAPGGGYVFSAGHNIQADVPAENIVALFDTALQAGQGHDR